MSAQLPQKGTYMLAISMACNNRVSVVRQTRSQIALQQRRCTAVQRVQSAAVVRGGRKAVWAGLRSFPAFTVVGLQGLAEEGSGGGPYGVRADGSIDAYAADACVQGEAVD